MKATVYDKVPSTAEISVRQIESYLRRTGWTDEVDGEGSRHHMAKRGEQWVHWCAGKDGASIGIEDLARWEGRLPSAVLADIAKELV